MLWFDVGIKRYTTEDRHFTANKWLWFDVGIKRYTTDHLQAKNIIKLWFDVGIKRYTTTINRMRSRTSCGLM